MKVKTLINIVRTNDIDKIKLLHKRIFSGDDLPRIDDNNTYWLVFANNKIAGFCIIRMLDKGRLAFLCRAGVFKKYAGLGIQKRMIWVRERFARESKSKSIITYVSPDNFKSIANLIKCDYRLYMPDWKYAGKDYLYFIKSVCNSKNK